jgi:hypothetical protein
MLKWTMSRDGKKRATIRLEHRVGVMEMAISIALQASCFEYTGDDSHVVAVVRGKHRERLSAVVIENMTREQFSCNPTALDCWQDKFPDYPEMPSADEIEKWCTAQVVAAFKLGADG